MKDIETHVAGARFSESHTGRRSGEDLSEILNVLIARAPELGITRIGDITGLDRIGIPVVQAVRPLGLANAVTQGKGIDMQSAAVSAILEAAEQFFAERIDRLHVVTASAEKLGIPSKLFARHLLPDAPPSWHTCETAWVEARDLIAGESGWLPLELVHTAYVHPGLETDGIFSASTTGLACGFTKADATLHGLLECVERDAIARAERQHGFFQRFRIDPDTVDDAALAELMRMVREAGLIPAFWLAPASGNVPAVWCQVMETGRLPLLTPYPADGFAADIDLFSAARRALLEAAQSRLAAISGTRDDISRAAFPTYTDWASIDAHRKLLHEGPKPLSFADLQEASPTFGGDPLHGLVSRLREHSVNSILVVEFDTDPIPEIAAVRAIMPELSPLGEP